MKLKLLIGLLFCFNLWAKAPIIYVHGVGAPHQIFSLVPFNSVFKKYNREVILAQTPMIGSIENSADILIEEIQRIAPNGKFHLFGHSMGGLVARAALKDPDVASRCLSLVTLSTPHQGSVVADYLLELIGREGMSARVHFLMEIFNNSMEMLNSLSTNYIQDVFNQEFENAVDVKYFSIGSFIPFGPSYFYTQNPYIILTHEIQKMYGIKDSDGPVSLESSKWGEFLGAFIGDHYSNTAPIPFAAHLPFFKHMEVAAKAFDRAEER